MSLKTFIGTRLFAVIVAFTTGATATHVFLGFTAKSMVEAYYLELIDSRLAAIVCPAPFVGVDVDGESAPVERRP